MKILLYYGWLVVSGGDGLETVYLLDIFGRASSISTAKPRGWATEGGGRSDARRPESSLTTGRPAYRKEKQIDG